MMKLFRVTSKVNNFSYKNKIYDSVEICWFVVHREHLTSYDQLIKDYGRELNNSHCISESNINELFTEEEANALRGYILKIHKQGCEIKRADLSVEVYTLGYGDIVPEYGEGFYKLNEEGDYHLPFVVWGYFDVSQARDVSWLRYGTEFIEKVLDKVGVSIRDKDRLESAIEELKEEGLFVEKGFNTKEKMKS